MKHFIPVSFGMSLQAFIAGLLAYADCISLSANQQLMAGCFFLAITFTCAVINTRINNVP